MAEATFVHGGAVIDYTPTTNIAAGQVVQHSDLVGVAPFAITANEKGSLEVAGVFDFVKTSALAIAVGDDVYFNDVTNEANKTAGVRAVGVLTFTGVGVADQTVTIDTTVYTWKASAAAAYEVTIGTQAQCEANLTNAINNGDAFGGLPHPLVTAVDGAGTVTISARNYGTAANGKATTETGTNMSWGATTLGSGTGGHTAGAGGVLLGKAVKAAANPSSLVRVKLNQ